MAVVRSHDAPGDGQRESHPAAEFLEGHELVDRDLAEGVDPVCPSDGDSQHAGAILCGALDTDAELVARHELPAVGDQQRDEGGAQPHRIAVDFGTRRFVLDRDPDLPIGQGGQRIDFPRDERGEIDQPWLKVASPASSTLKSFISAIRPDSLAVDFSISPSILRWVSVSAPARPVISMRRYPAMTVTGVRNSCTPSREQGIFSRSRRRRVHPSSHSTREQIGVYMGFPLQAPP